VDPIHPILPTPPTFPPVAPAPGVRRVTRDGNQGAGGQERRRRPPRLLQDEPDPGREDVDDDGASHVDVTA
jgi:hypothetical protein